MKLKRLVTSEAGAGRVGVDVKSITSTPADGVRVVWGFDGPPTLPLDAEELVAMATPRGLLPPVGGARVCLSTIPPAGDQPDLEEIDFGAAGVTLHESGNGLHRTDSIDIFVVLEGAITVLQPDGAGGEEETKLEAGDLFVETGTFHRWHNGSDRPCTLLAFVVGAERSAG